MDEAEALYRLRTLPDEGLEMAHGKADEILVQFLRDNGFPDVADAFDEACYEIGFRYA